MRCGTGPMREQRDGPRSHDLNVPAKSGGFDKTARLAIGPIGTIGTPRQSCSPHAVTQPKEPRSSLVHAVKAYDHFCTMRFKNISYCMIKSTGISKCGMAPV